MPVYNYVCSECGSNFEHYLSFKDADQVVRCPNGHMRTRKMLSVPTVVFKGSGFYVNDHRAKSANEKSS